MVAHKQVGVLAESLLWAALGAATVAVILALIVLGQRVRETKDRLDDRARTLAHLCVVAQVVSASFEVAANAATGRYRYNHLPLELVLARKFRAQAELIRADQSACSFK